MTVDQISQQLGALNADMRHQTKAIDLLTESVSDIKERLIRGSSRMDAMEGRIDKIEPAVDDHIAACQSSKERKIGAELYRKGVWAVIGAAIAYGGGMLAKIGVALVGGH
jgi:hypothetical protein